MSENKFTDTLNQLLDQLETVKTEIEKQNARMKQMEASNEELLELLEFCCYRTTPGADCWCQHGLGLVKFGHCSEESYCPVWQSIQKARGQGCSNSNCQ